MKAAEPLARAGGGKWNALLALARPHQWIKNGLVLAALVFSQHLFDLRYAALASLGVAAFCAISSAGYVLNDWLDRETDRAHLEKRNRPLASGELTGADALKLGGALAAIGLGLSAALGADFVAIAAAYLALQWVYSSYVKRVVVADVVVVAIGFVLRAYAGGAAINVEVSPWLVLITFLLALFVALARRRHELTALGAAATVHRMALGDYSIGLIDQMISIVTAATLAAYMVYTASSEVAGKLGTHHLYMTVPFVVFGIFRYLYLVHKRQEGGDPARMLLRDGPLLLSFVLWVAADIMLLYW